MAVMRVNPTRMELTKLKKRLKVAMRGHKLLKDKRDELMKQFLEIVKENKLLRENVEKRLKSVYDNFLVSRAVMSKESIEEALMFPKQGVSLDVGEKNIMSVDVPVFEYKFKSENMDDIYPYGFANTSGELDMSVHTLSEIFPELIRLSETEKTVMLLAQEIEKTRRRVNALEYVMIPQFQETIKYITMKLEENERGNITRLMKVKDMMIEEELRKKKMKQA